MFNVFNIIHLQIKYLSVVGLRAEFCGITNVTVRRFLQKCARIECHLVCATLKSTPCARVYSYFMYSLLLTYMLYYRYIISSKLSVSTDLVCWHNAKSLIKGHLYLTHAFLIIGYGSFSPCMSYQMCIPLLCLFKAP